MPEPTLPKVAINLCASPESIACKVALEYCEGLRQRSIEIYRIFIFGSAAQLCVEQESQLNRSWSLFLSNSNIDAVVCVQSALDYSLVSNDGTPRDNVVLHACYSIGGLAQLTDACISADKIITFG